MILRQVAAEYSQLQLIVCKTWADFLSTANFLGTRPQERGDAEKKMFILVAGRGCRTTVKQPSIVVIYNNISLKQSDLEADFGAALGTNNLCERTRTYRLLRCRL